MGRSWPRNTALLCLALAAACPKPPSPPALTALIISPEQALVAQGNTVQFVAMGRYSDGSAQVLTRRVGWVVDDSLVARLDPSTPGLVQGLAKGTTTVRASLDAVIASRTLTVTASTIRLLQLYPPRPIVPVGLEVHLQVFAVRSDQTVDNVTSEALWSSSDAALFDVTAGRVVGHTPGAGTLSVSYQGALATVPLAVTSAAVARVEVEPPAFALPAGLSRPLTAIATLTDQTTLDVTATADWASDNAAIASVSNSDGSHGAVTAVAPGTATIGATFGGRRGTATVRVTQAVLAGLQLSPASARAAKGTSVSYLATAVFSDGTSVDVTGATTFTSTAPAVASVSGHVATGLSVGSASIAAVYGTLRATAALTISDATLVRIDIAPSPVAVARGTTTQLTATGLFSDGSTQDLTQRAMWSVADGAVASISNAPQGRGELSGLARGTSLVSAEVDGVLGTAPVTVTAAVLTRLELSPAGASLPLGTSRPLAATATFSDATTQDVTADVTWNSADPTVVALSNAADNKGLARALALGTSIVSATLLGISGSTSITVTAAALVSLSIAPSSLTLPVGYTTPLSATGIYSDNSTAPLTTVVTWTTDAPSVAAVDARVGHEGTLSALAVGSTIVRAQLGSVSTSLGVTVTPAVLSALEVSPAAASVAAGATQPFIAMGTWSDHTTHDVTALVTWDSSAPSTATISNATGTQGVALARAKGSATLTASLAGLSAHATLTVTDAQLVALAIEPGLLSLTRGSTAALTARGTYSDGSLLDLTAAATWRSSDDAVALVSNASGQEGTLSAVSVGSADITVQLGSVAAHVHVTVTPAVLLSLDVSPGAATAPLGTALALAATGHYSDGTAQDLTGTVAWTSSAPSVAAVSNAAGSAGRVTASAKGTATVTAAFASLQASARIDVTDAALSQVAISPSSPRVAAQTAMALHATGVWTDGTTQDLTGQSTWASSDAAVATVSNVAPHQGQLSALTSGVSTVTATFGGVTGSTTVTVTGATLVAVDVTPPSPSAPVGLSLALTATGRFNDGTTQDVTALAIWSSSDPTSASVSNATGDVGVVTALAIGAPVITATLLGIQGHVTFTVTAAELLALDVTPATATLPRGLSQSFTATGTFTGGTKQDLTGQVVWSSGDVSVATVSNASGTEGLAQALGVGLATITASLTGHTASATLHVTPAALTALAVTPVLPSMPKGLSVQFTATGTYTDGTTQDLTQAAAWTTGDAAVATISNGASGGTAIGTGVGQTAVTATVGTRSATTSLTVTSAQLTSVGVTPANPSVPLGLTQALRATGLYTDGTTQDLTALAAWTTSDASVATVSNAMGSAGVASALGQGTATLTATYGGRSGTTQLSVTSAVLRAIELTPPTPSAPAGRTLQLTATGVYTDNSTQPLTAAVAWTTSDAAIASVSNAAGSEGLVSALAVGSATIRATLSGLTAAVTFTVTPAVLQAIQVTPANVARPRGLSQAFGATGIYSDSTTQDLTSAVTWSSSAPTVASISNAAGSAGLASALNVGATSITAALSGVTGATPFTVTAAELVRLDVSPKTVSAPLGAVRQLSATGTYTDGTTQNLTAVATWSSSNPSVVSVSNAAGSRGLATTISTGSVTISATVTTFSDMLTMTVTQAALASIDITPAGGATALGYTRQFIAIGTYSDGTTQVLTSSVTWASSDAQVAIISNGAASRGLLSTVTAGAITITAMYSGITGSTTHTVTPAVLVAVDVSPASVTLAPAGTQSLTATGTFSDGTTQDLTTTATWTSSAPSVAQVSNVAPHGLVTAVATGTATISAAASGHSGSSTVTVTP